MAPRAAPPLSRAAFLFFLLANTASPFCVIEQTCSPASPSCLPSNVTGAPFPLNETGPLLACPQYAASACCTPFADEQLFLSLLAAEQEIGEPAQAGCPACFANVRALWCAAICSPDQSNFIRVLGVQNASVAPGEPAELALAAEFNISPRVIAGVFSSCSGTGLVRNTPALQTPVGFFDGMRAQVLAAAHLLVNFSSVSWAAPLRDVAAPFRAAPFDFDPLPCTNFPANTTEPGATGNTSCPCASCLASCPPR